MTNSEVRIGSCIPKTGNFAKAGNGMTQGATLFFDHLNAEGGVAGRKVKFMTFDDQYQPEKAIDCFNDFPKNEIFAGVNFYGAASIARWVRLGETNKIPLVGFANGSLYQVEPFKRYSFMTRTLYSAESETLAQHVWDDIGVRRIAVFYQNDASGIGQMDGFISTIKKKGGDIVASVPFARDFSDVEAGVDTLRKSNPEAVLVTGGFPGPVKMVKYLDKIGWHPLVLTLGARGSLAEVAGKLADGAVITNAIPSPEWTDRPLIALYRKLAKEKGIKPTYVSLEGFLNAAIMTKGLEAAGKNLTRESLVDSLETLGGKDIGLGDIVLHYSKTSRVGITTPYYWVVKDGKMVEIKDWKALKPAAKS